MRLTPTQNSQGAGYLTKYPAPHENSSNPFAMADTYTEKAIVRTLMAIDALSYISPFRWLPHLAGCGGPAETSDGGNENENNLTACLKDTDCREPRICEGGKCVYPPENSGSGEDDKTNDSEQDADSATVIQCKPGDTRSCGPCDIGIQSCGEDHLWEGACHYTPNQLERPCYTGTAATKNVGECREGVQSCATGSWGSCEREVKPRNEICNGKDDDCDGQTDEGENSPTLTRPFYPGDPETLDVGICRSGLQYCNGGNWVTSVEPVLPQAETCDDQDNDCNGEMNENACGPKIGDPCHEQLDCESRVCIPHEYYPGGYCSDNIHAWVRECMPGTNYRRAVCVHLSELNVDNILPFFVSPAASFCVVTCETDSGCRTEEGYHCKPIRGSSFKACLPQNEEVTIGYDRCSR